MFKTFYFYKFIKNYFKISTCFSPTIYGFLSNQRNIKYHPIIHISILYCIVSENNKFQLPISSYQKLQALGHKNVVLYLQVLKIILSKHNWMFFMKDNHFRMGKQVPLLIIILICFIKTCVPLFPQMKKKYQNPCQLNLT